MKILLVVGLLSLALASCKVDSAVVEAPASSVASAINFHIAIRESNISFGGKNVKMGQSLDDWKKAVPGTPRCTDEQIAPLMCTWDNVGLQVGTDDGLKNVKFASLFLLVPTIDPDPLPPLPDGSPAGVSTVARPPQKPFTGRLQLDGVDITAKLPFSNVRSSIDRRRNVRCGSRDCSIPHGKFGNGAQIFFELDGRSESDNCTDGTFASERERKMKMPIAFDSKTGNPNAMTEYT